MDQRTLELVDSIERINFTWDPNVKKRYGDSYTGKYGKSYDFLGWAATNYGTRHAAEDARVGRSVERTNGKPFNSKLVLIRTGTLGYSTFFSVPLNDYPRFIENFIIQRYCYGKNIPLDESISRPTFRLFFDFDLKDLSLFDKKMLGKIAYICSTTVSEFYPTFKNSTKRDMPQKGYVLKEETGDWTMDADDVSFSRLCSLW
jgi:hypothetical protein